MEQCRNFDTVPLDFTGSIKVFTHYRPIQMGTQNSDVHSRELQAFLGSRIYFLQQVINMSFAWCLPDAKFSIFPQLHNGNCYSQALMEYKCGHNKFSLVVKRSNINYCIPDFPYGDGQIIACFHPNPELSSQFEGFGFRFNGLKQFSVVGKTSVILKFNK